MNTNDLEVVNNEQENRFEISLDGKMAFAEYRKAGKNIIFTHTEVPPEFEGKGIGTKLARTALEYAKTNDLKVQALCPFINAYVKRHPEYHPITWGYGV